MPALILASGSDIRATLLRNAAVPFTVQTARVDEDAVRQALEAESAPPRDVADTLAEMKARRVSEKNQGSLVMGCDQVLAFQGKVFAKPSDPQEAIDQLHALRGQRHTLYSAAVIYEDGQPVWRHVGMVHLSMRMATDSYIADYVARNWDSIRHSVGGYKIEEEGARLFTRIDGDYFTILGLPLLQILSYLTTRDMLSA